MAKRAVEGGDQRSRQAGGERDAIPERFIHSALGQEDRRVQPDVVPSPRGGTGPGHERGEYFSDLEAAAMSPRCPVDHRHQTVGRHPELEEVT